MALRYGGEVRTRSTVWSRIESFRASPRRTAELTVDSNSPPVFLKGSRVTAVRNLLPQPSKGSTTSLSRCLWGRDRDRSRANEAPADLEMIKLEKTTHAKSFSFPFVSSSMASARAQSCVCDSVGNQ